MQTTTAATRGAPTMTFASQSPMTVTCRTCDARMFPADAAYHEAVHADRRYRLTLDAAIRFAEATVATKPVRPPKGAALSEIRAWDRAQSRRAEAAARLAELTAERDELRRRDNRFHEAEDGE